MKSVVNRNCPYCRQKRVPHEVLENRKNSPVRCMSCGVKYTPTRKKDPLSDLGHLFR